MAPFGRILSVIAASFMLLAAFGCDTRREVQLEWPTPAAPTSEEAYESIIRTAGPAGLDQDPNPADLQQYYRARDQFLNAWRRENWELARQSPKEYERVMAEIEAKWDDLYRQYWQDDTPMLPQPPAEPEPEPAQ